MEVAQGLKGSSERRRACGGSQAAWASSMHGLELTQGDHPCKLAPLLPLGKSLCEANHVSVYI
ncbi:hypothetical protein M758_11G014600 [Ceratodon purpureus]|nr:hypothetical protein M758_11G014600 [Ceratodon purpureus]